MIALCPCGEPFRVSAGGEVWCSVCGTDSSLPPRYTRIERAWFMVVQGLSDEVPTSSENPYRDHPFWRNN